MKTRQEKAMELVEYIIDDITGRSGGDAFWEPIDEEVKREIKELWASVIAPHIKEPKP